MGNFARNPDLPRTVVTWELEKIDNDKTNLKLVHTGFKADEKVKSKGRLYWITLSNRQDSTKTIIMFLLR